MVDTPSFKTETRVRFPQPSKPALPLRINDGVIMEERDFQMIVERATFELKLMIGNHCIDHGKLLQILEGKRV